MSKIVDMRHEYHRKVSALLIFMKKGNIPRMADVSSKGSTNFSKHLVNTLGFKVRKSATKGQTTGKGFEDLTRDFLQEVFAYLQRVRPGRWRFSVHEEISAFTQYKHLGDLTAILKTGLTKDTRTNLKNLTAIRKLQRVSAYRYWPVTLVWLQNALSTTGFIKCCGKPNF